MTTIEFSGHFRDHKTVRGAFFAAAAAMRGVSKLPFKRTPCKSGERWKADGATYTRKTTKAIFSGDTRDPDPTREDGEDVVFKLRAGNRVIRLYECWPGGRLAGTISSWPGLQTFEAIRVAFRERLVDTDYFRDGTVTPPRRLDQARDALEAGDREGAVALLDLYKAAGLRKLFDHDTYDYLRNSCSAE